MAKEALVSYSDHLKDYISSDYINPKVLYASIFLLFLEKNGCFQSSSDELVIDMGTGGRSGLAYFAKSFPGPAF